MHLPFPLTWAAGDWVIVIADLALFQRIIIITWQKATHCVQFRQVLLRASVWHAARTQHAFVDIKTEYLNRKYNLNTLSICRYVYSINSHRTMREGTATYNISIDTYVSCDDEIECMANWKMGASRAVSALIYGCILHMWSTIYLNVVGTSCGSVFFSNVHWTRQRENGVQSNGTRDAWLRHISKREAHDELLSPSKAMKCAAHLNQNRLAWCEKKIMHSLCFDRKSKLKKSIDKNLEKNNNKRSNLFRFIVILFTTNMS